MFGSLGGPEVILILVIALIVFGPRRLPEIGKSMGKMLAEFRKASNDFKRTIEDEVEAEKSKDSQPALPPPGPAPEAPPATVHTIDPGAYGYGAPPPAEADAAAPAGTEAQAPAPPAPQAREEPEPAVTAEDRGRAADDK